MRFWHSLLLPVDFLRDQLQRHLDNVHLHLGPLRSHPVQRVEDLRLLPSLLFRLFRQLQHIVHGLLVGLLLEGRDNLLQ